MSSRGEVWLNIALSLLVIAWGVAYPLVKYLLAWFTPLELLLLRFWITCLPLLVIAIATRRELYAQVRAWPWRATLVALLGVPAYHLTLNLGIKLLVDDPATESSAAMLSSILVATVPVWTALLAVLVRQETLRPLQWFGQVIAFAGVVLIVSRGDLVSFRPSPGALWLLGAPLSWALYSVVARPLLLSVRSSLPITSFVILLGTLIMTLFTPTGIFAHAAALSAPAWLALVSLALLATFAGYVIWAVAVKHLGANRPSTYLYLIPLVSVGVSMVKFEEKITTVVVAGGMMILLGVLLCRGDLLAILRPRRLD